MNNIKNYYYYQKKTKKKKHYINKFNKYNYLSF